ncbi:MAG: hypothetical protein ACKOPM_06235 [Novosphingobium sp.]
MPTDRTLFITAKPTLTWYSPTFARIASMQYTQGDTNPNMPNLVNPVTGDIRLGRMPSTPGFTDNVDITIALDSSAILDSTGTHVVAQWAPANDGGMSGQPPATAYCWFINNPVPGMPIDYTAISVPGMSTSVDIYSNVLIDDNTPDDKPGQPSKYTFCLGLSVWTSQGPRVFVPIEPQIIGKGVGSK